MGRQIQVELVKIGDFRQITRYISKKRYEKNKVVRALSNGDIADDLECPLTASNHHFYILHRLSDFRNGYSWKHKIWYIGWS